MHDKIIQIGDRPIDKEEYIDESEFYEHWFIGSIADYVNEVPSSKRTSVISDFLNCPGLRYDPEEDTLTIVDKKSYFKSKYDRFKECIEEIRKWSIDEFSSVDLNFTFIKLKDMYEDKYGTYLYDRDAGDMCCLDEWVRIFDNGSTVHIGNVIDYHW